MSTVFRWSVWGNKRHFAIMLPVSVGTFRRAFGNDARYVVVTDEPSEVRPLLDKSVEVIPDSDLDRSLFTIDSVATWKKWSPTPRLASNSTQFYVDADVFLVGDPIELRRFATPHSSFQYLVMQERVGSKPWVGRFSPRIFKGLPPINIGLVGQRPGTDITADLFAEFRWWQKHVPPEQRQFHDDQGAVAAILSRAYLFGQVELLPQDRYRIVSHRSNSDLTGLEGIVAIHATMDHSAFRRFRAEIETFMSAEPPLGNQWL